MEKEGGEERDKEREAKKYEKESCIESISEARNVTAKLKIHCS
jgi:hypothetical protein